MSVPKRCFIFLYAMILVSLVSCSSGSQTPSYLTIVLPCKQDTTGMFKRIQLMETFGEEYQVKKQDTADLRNYISKPIIKHIRQLEFIENIQDLTSADSVIIVVELKNNIHPIDAKYQVEDKIKDAEKDLPSDLDQYPFILSKNIRNNKDQGVSWARGNADSEFQDYLRKDPDWMERNSGRITGKIF